MDLINFGVCPGIVLYIWGLDKLGWAGFLVSLIYVASMVSIKLFVNLCLILFKFRPVG